MDPILVLHLAYFGSIALALGTLEVQVEVHEIPGSHRRKAYTPEAFGT